MAYLGRARLMNYVTTDTHVAYSLSLLLFLPVLLSD